MARYIEYIPSIYSWLGDIPSHWEEKSIRQITKVSSERLENRNLPLLSVYREYGVIPKKSRDDNHNVESSDLSNYKVVYKDNLVLNKMKMWQGSLGVSKYNGIVSPAYIVCKIVDESLNVRFLHFLLRTAKYKTYYNQYSYGIRVGQWDMHYEDLKNMKVYIPPLTEQEQIVRFLDWKVSEINKLIGIKQKKISRLTELQKAVINETVTHGLNKNAPMKFSGVEWIGNIPSHWQINKLKRVTTVRNEKGIYEPNITNRYIGLENVKSYSNDIIVTLSEYDKSVQSICCKGDLMFSKLRPYLAKVIIAPYDSFCTGEMLIISSFDGDMRFLRYLMLHESFINSVDSSTYGAKMPRANPNYILNMQLPIPQIDEQREIANYIDEKTLKIDNVVKKQLQIIAELQEFKSSLISDVVTGKIDVRNVEIPEYEHIDDVVDDGDDKENEEELADAEETEL